MMKKSELIEKLNDLKKSHLGYLTPKSDTSGSCYVGTYRVRDYNELIGLISSLLKVCTLSLEYSERLNDWEISTPNYDVLEVLRFILQLIPFREIELIDEFNQLVEAINAEEESQN